MSGSSGSVLDLSAHEHNLGVRIAEITQGKGINVLIDNVGGTVTGELIRSMAFGGRVIINGVMSEERFELHNQDILMKGLEIKAHVYRYFFDPPRPGDEATLQQIIAASERADFTVAAAGLHPLADFRTAISETLNSPGRGKHFFAFPV
jgi:NADPH:quinone reductase-like Zn-dependent oxidoreductase